MNKKKTGKPNNRYLIAAVGVVVLLVIGIAVCVKRYKPTTARMELSDYFETHDGEVSVIINGTYLQPNEDEDYYGVIGDDIYLSVPFVKDHMDNGLVVDEDNGILRYTNDKDIISASVGESKYTVSGKTSEAQSPVLIKKGNTYYVGISFLNSIIDFTYETADDPNRVVIFTAGTEVKRAEIRKATQMRRFGGVKSKILKDAEKGESVYIIENYGKWSLVLSDDGVLGCVKNSKLKNKKDSTVKARLPERNYEHKTMDKKVVLGWHQVTNETANATFDDVCAGTSGMNVICPTWFQISSNQGDIASFASVEYVSKAHAKNLMVWGLLSNIEKEVDISTLLNSAVARDNLIKKIIGEAERCNLDGINIDLEQVPVAAGDGFTEFIKELSLACEKSDIFLSVDNYPPTASSAHYNLDVQNNYADYVIIMAYDEHWVGGDAGAGSISSLPFVKNSIKNTLENVDKDRTIIALPFYTKVWKTSDSGVTASALSMADTDEYLTRHSLKATWLDEEAQNYAEYEEDGTLYQIWIEDKRSLSEKLDACSDASVAGVAFWKLGQENKSVWETIKSKK